jgi:hypothetical protein
LARRSSPLVDTLSRSLNSKRAGLLSLKKNSASHTLTRLLPHHVIIRSNTWTCARNMPLVVIAKGIERRRKKRKEKKRKEKKAQ